MLRSGARAICMGLLFRCMWRCLGGGAVGGRSERSTKIRKIRHIGRLLLACILCLLCFLEHLGFDFRNLFFARELVDLMFCSTPLPSKLLCSDQRSCISAPGSAADPWHAPDQPHSCPGSATLKRPPHVHCALQYCYNKYYNIRAC